MIFLYRSTVASINNRNGLLPVYEEHLVLEDEEENTRTYDYDETDKVFLKRQMLIIQGRPLGREVSRPRYNSWDRVDVQLKEGQTDTQDWADLSFWSDRYAERIDLEAAQEALENKVATVQLNDVCDREVKDSPYFD